MNKSALKGLISFFTIIPLRIGEGNVQAMERRFWMAPLAGAVIAVVVFVVSSVLLVLDTQYGFGDGLFTAVVVLATVFAFGRFLHFDGLADFGDGCVVAGDREKHVRALKDTAIGAGGLGVAVTVTLLNVSVYAMAGAYIVTIAAVTEILVKNAQVSAAAFGRPGNGMAAGQVAGTTGLSVIVSSILSFVLSALFAFASVLVMNEVKFKWIPDVYSNEEIIAVCIFAGLVGILISVIVGWAVARKANGTFGMVNGDVLGATNEISRVFVVLAFVAITAVLRCRH